jgi:hypothetical protein
VVSLALVVVGFAVIHGVFMGPLSGKSGNAAAPPQVAAQMNAPPPQARASDDGGLTGHSPGPSQSEPSASNPS